jgi:hypothetical protein
VIHHLGKLDVSLSPWPRNKIGVPRLLPAIGLVFAQWWRHWTDLSDARRSSWDASGSSFFRGEPEDALRCRVFRLARRGRGNG